jgi:hypothetical protein
MGTVKRETTAKRGENNKLQDNFVNNVKKLVRSPSVSTVPLARLPCSIK